MKELRIFVFSAFLLYANICTAQLGEGGSTGLAFLKLGVGARASGLGEAYTALSSDATATFWNPAGLASSDRTQLAFTHTEWLQDISNDFLAVVFPAFGGTVGLSFYSNNINGVERRVIPSPEPLGTVDANDIAAGVSYGRFFGSRFSGGLTVKYLYEKIFVESASGYAFDLGFNSQPFDAPLKLGLVVQNIGSMGKLLNQSVDLPRTVRFGATYWIDLHGVEGAIILAADGVKVLETDIRGNFGAELQLKNHLAFRVGYQTGFDEKTLGGGFGLNFNRYHLDYGFTPFDSNLGDTHRFSFGLEL